VNDKRSTYAQWAETYDRDPNPVISLARRLMEPLLRDVRDKVVVDIGCGTGHDLDLIVSRGGKAVGFDTTPEMLRQAAKRKSIRTRLVQADARNLPLQEGSADLVVCSFVLSFMGDVSQLAEQLARIALPNAEVYVLDMHPEAQRDGWCAALNPNVKDIPLNVHELTRIQQAFDAAGFELELLLEPKLGHPERRLFEICARPDLYEQARHVPAMYMFHFRRRMLTTDRNRPHVIPRRRQHAWYLTGARVSLGPHTAIHAEIVMDSSRVRGIYDRPSKAKAQLSADDVVVDLSGLLLLPGLINAHDHLDAGWPKRVLPEVAPWLGALRSLLSGVTTVVHDDVLELSGVTQFPIRFARNYARSAKQSPDGVVDDLRGASPDLPLVIDIAWCGAETGGFIRALDRRGLLTGRTILVGVAQLDVDSQKILLERKTAVVWAPSDGSVSRDFVINNHLIALGTGGTGKGIFAEEIRAAVKMEIPPEAIYSMVTSRAASILRLRNGEGRIVAENPADMLAVADAGVTPAQTLCALDHSPLAVVLGGRPMLVNNTLLERVPESLRDPLRSFTMGADLWWAEEHIVAAVRGAHRSGQKIRVSGQSVKA
jgi:ubiquinone/menaquinone biosynthesis C-methylase UbiE